MYSQVFYGQRNVSKMFFSGTFMKVANPRFLWFKETIVFWKTVRLDQVLNDRVWVIKIHTFYVLLFIFEISVPFILGRYTKMKGTFILMMRIFSNLAIMLKTWVREIFPISSQNFSIFSVIFFVKVWTYTLVVIDVGSDSKRWVFLSMWFSLNSYSSYTVCWVLPLRPPQTKVEHLLSSLSIFGHYEPPVTTELQIKYLRFHILWGVLLNS